MNKIFPNLAFWEKCRAFCMLDYFHIQITRLRELHNNAQGLARFLIKCLFVCNYIRMPKIKYQHMNLFEI